MYQCDTDAPAQGNCMRVIKSLDGMGPTENGWGIKNLGPYFENEWLMYAIDVCWCLGENMHLNTY